MAKKYFTSIDELKEQCEQAIIALQNPIDVIELWKPCYLNDKEPRREIHINVLKINGYYDSIYFKIGEEEKAMQVYNTLKCFNRNLTPLEKYHASSFIKHI